MRIIALAYIYELAKFGDLWLVLQKIYSKMHLVSCTNTHRGVTDLVNHGMFKNIKTWISWERNIIFLWNKKVLNLCFRWKILRSYRFVAEVTFNILIHYQIFKGYLCYKTIFSWNGWQKIDQTGRGSGLLVSLSLLSAQRNSTKRPYFLLPL